MKWTYYYLSDSDTRAKNHVFKNLEIGAYEHTLSRKLLSRFSRASGPMVLVAFELLDLHGEYLYEYATYDSGKGLRQLPGWETVSWTDSPRWGLVAFVNGHLLASREAVALCENLAATRKAITNWPRESRVLLYGDEIYHILTADDVASPDSIESAIRESEHHWATGVCSSCGEVPHVEIRSEQFFDEVVAKTVHIFTPALDGEGYLIWSPRL